MNNRKRIELLEEAQELLRDAHDKVRRAISGTCYEANWKTYFLDHLRIMIDGEHGFLCRDMNVGKMINELEAELEEERAIKILKKEIND